MFQRCLQQIRQVGRILTKAIQHGGRLEARILRSSIPEEFGDQRFVPDRVTSALQMTPEVAEEVSFWRYGNTTMSVQEHRQKRCARSLAAHNEHRLECSSVIRAVQHPEYPTCAKGCERRASAEWLQFQSLHTAFPPDCGVHHFPSSGLTTAVPSQAEPSRPRAIVAGRRVGSLPVSHSHGRPPAAARRRRAATQASSRSR